MKIYGMLTFIKEHWNTMLFLTYQKGFVSKLTSSSKHKKPKKPKSINQNKKQVLF